MVSAKFALHVACLSASLLCVMSVPVAHADVYQIYNLGNANALSVYGITDSGTVVIAGAVSNGCAGDAQAASCFYTYSDGMQVASASSAPSLAYDNGAPCGGNLPSAGVVGMTACNNSREAFFASFDSPQVKGLFSGPDPIHDLVFAGTSVDALALNALGDIAWTDGRDEWNYEAIDLTTRSTLTPEPGSLALLGTGLLGGLAAVRRRLRG